MLQHGFAIDANLTWVATGVADALAAGGRRVIAIDARGSGASAKPHDVASYGESRMAADLTALCDALGAETFDLVGYSHGAIVSLIAATEEPRIRRLVVGAVGVGTVELGGVHSRVIPQGMVEAMTADDPRSLTDPRSAALRGVADAIGADRKALAALAESRHSSPIPLGQIKAPTLILAGDRDPLAKRPEVLQAAIPGARLRVVAGDHMGALADPEFVASVIDFLAG